MCVKWPANGIDIRVDHKEAWAPLCWKTDAFKLWCWRRLLRVPWTARSNQSILKEISPEYSLEGLMMKLKLWSDVKFWLIGKDPAAGKDWGQEEKGQQRMRWLEGILDSMDMSFCKFQDIVKDRKPGVLQSMGFQRAGYNLVTEQQEMIDTQ